MQVLREIAPQGSWAAFGSAAHWIFAQGYVYLAAMMFDVGAVAPLAATRLLVQPVALLSTGIGTLMLPTASKWTVDHEPRVVLRRLILFATLLAAMSGVYLIAVWYSRDWIFESLLRKHPERGDLLLAMWSFIGLVVIYRDQLLHFLVARAQFRASSTVTAMGAMIAVIVCLFAMRWLGVAGVLLGVMAGEIANLAGIAWSVRTQISRERDRPNAAT
jgi:O-antigen/teichoic acid export membrane protein